MTMTSRIIGAKMAISRGFKSRMSLSSSFLANFFTKLRKEYGDADGVLKLFASHPGLGGRAERAAAADRIGGGTYKPVLSDQSKSPNRIVGTASWASPCSRYFVT